MKRKRLYRRCQLCSVTLVSDESQKTGFCKKCRTESPRTEPVQQRIFESPKPPVKPKQPKLSKEGVIV